MEAYPKPALMRWRQDRGNAIGNDCFCPFGVPWEDILAMLTRCFARRHGNRWEAVCLDFDLAVQGDSFDDVYHSLDTAVGEYVKYVATIEDSAERQAFLTRRVPLALRLKFTLSLILASLLLPGRNGRWRDSNHGFGTGFTLPATA